MKVLIIAVHPDDETLGCGGSILKHIANEDNVRICFVTDGNKHQSKLIENISTEYGIEKYYRMKLAELQLSDISLNILIPKFTEIIEDARPDILYIPNRSDVHSDHRKVFEALIPLSKNFRFPFIRKILMCEVHSETDLAYPLQENSFLPNYYSDITPFWNKKKEILKYFKSEILESPNTRNIDAIEALNRYRGSIICCHYAEAFMLLFEKS